MDTEHILQRLCAYDSRNPDYLDEGKKDPCYCDNCFYGRTALAEEIIRLNGIIGSASKSLLDSQHLPAQYTDDIVKKVIKTLNT